MRKKTPLVRIEMSPYSTLAMRVRAAATSSCPQSSKPWRDDQASP